MLVFGQKKKRNSSATTVELFPDRSILTMLPVNKDVKSPARRFEFNKHAIEELNINSVDESTGEISNCRIDPCNSVNKHGEKTAWHIHLSSDESTGIKVGVSTFSFSSKYFYDEVAEFFGIKESDELHHFELIPDKLQDADGNDHQVYTLGEVVVSLSIVETDKISETVKLTEELV